VIYEQENQGGKKEDERFPLPDYPAKDDIYKQEEESDIDPDTGSKKQEDDEDPSSMRTWIYPVPSWMMTMKPSERKMKKIITIAWGR